MRLDGWRNGTERPPTAVTPRRGPEICLGSLAVARVLRRTHRLESGEEKDQSGSLAGRERCKCRRTEKPSPGGAASTSIWW